MWLPFTEWNTHIGHDHYPLPYILVPKPLLTVSSVVRLKSLPYIQSFLTKKVNPYSAAQVPLLLSDACFARLSTQMKENCRPIDCVTVKGSAVSQFAWGCSDLFGYIWPLTTRKLLTRTIYSQGIWLYSNNIGNANPRMWHAQVPIRLYTLYSWCYSQLEDPIMGPTTLDQEEFACHWKKAYEAYIAGNWPVSTVSLSTSSTVSLFIINRVSEPTTVTYFL